MAKGRGARSAQLERPGNEREFMDPVARQYVEIDLFDDGRAATSVPTDS